MCLSSLYKKPFIASYAIPCHKRFRLDPEGFFTPYAGTNLTELSNDLKGTSYKEVIKELNKGISIYPLEDKVEIEYNPHTERYEISSGMIHSYVASYNTDIDCSFPLIDVRGYIPKGSKFYLSANFKSICSDKLVLDSMGFLLNSYNSGIFAQGENIVPDLYNEKGKQIINEIIEKHNLNNFLKYSYIVDKTRIQVIIPTLLNSIEQAESLGFTKLNSKSDSERGFKNSICMFSNKVAKQAFHGFARNKLFLVDERVLMSKDIPISEDVYNELEENLIDYDKES